LRRPTLLPYPVVEFAGGIQVTEPCAPATDSPLYAPPAETRRAGHSDRYPPPVPPRSHSPPLPPPATPHPPAPPPPQTPAPPAACHWSSPAAPSHCPPCA